MRNGHARDAPAWLGRPKSARRKVVLDGWEIVDAERARARRALLVRSAIVVASLASCVWWLWFRPLSPLYVAVIHPEIEGDLPEDFAAALRTCLAGDLGLLRNTYPVRARDVEGAAGDLRSIARAVGATEVITSRIEAVGSTCWVEITRNRQGREPEPMKFQVAPATAAAVAGSARPVLARLYKERRRLFRKAQGADYAAFSEIQLRINSQSADFEQILEELAKLRGRNSPIEAYRTEISTARYLYETTGEAKYIEDARQVLSEAPDHPNIILAAVELELAAGETARAQELLVSVTDEHPEKWWFRERILERKGEWERAAAVSREALIVRESWWHHLTLAKTLRKSGELGEARECLYSALGLAPENKRVLGELAELEFESGNLQIARDLYRKLATPEEHTPRYLVNLGTIDILLGDYQQAIMRYELILWLGYQEPEVLLNFADACRLAGDPRSTELYGRLLEKTQGTDQPGLLACRAQALACLGQKAEAVATIQHALSRDQTAEILYTAAIVFSVIGERAKSGALAAEARANGMGEAWFNLPWFKGEQ